MGNLSKEELMKLYETLPEDTLKKLGVYDEAKESYEKKQEIERLKHERLQRAVALVKEAQELLDIYNFEMRVTARGTRIVGKDERTVYGDLQKRSQTGSKLPKGIKTPGIRYRYPILQALVDLGGQGKTSIVLERVYEQMKDSFVPADLEELSSVETPRWNNTARWERYKMVKKGLLRKDSPNGVWEISEKGREYLQGRK